MNAPGYWMHETSGVLRHAVEAFLNGHLMSNADIGATRSYLRQWMAGDWTGEMVPTLRARIDEIYDRATLSAWLDDALAAGIDPL